MISAPLQTLIEHFEQLSPERLDALAALYSEDCSFHDPFNHLHGRASVRAVFADMYATLDVPRFVVLDAFETLEPEHRAFLSWDCHFRHPRLGEHSIHGSTLLHFDAHGLVSRHRDYWDAAESIYEHIPLLGGVLRAIKRRIATHPPI
jgi:steroid delta-isomerase